LRQKEISGTEMVYERLVFSMKSTIDKEQGLLLDTDPWSSDSELANAMRSRIHKTSLQQVEDVLSSKFDVDEEQGVSHFYVNPAADYMLELYEHRGYCGTANIPVADGGFSMKTKDGGMVLYCWYGIEFDDGITLIHYISHSPIYLDDDVIVIDCEVIDEKTARTGTARGTTFLLQEDDKIHVDTRNVIALGCAPPGVRLSVALSEAAEKERIESLLGEEWELESISLKRSPRSFNRETTTCSTHN
jgi:hypothetical protein